MSGAKGEPAPLDFPDMSNPGGNDGEPEWEPEGQAGEKPGSVLVGNGASGAEAGSRALSWDELEKVLTRHVETIVTGFGMKTEGVEDALRVSGLRNGQAIAKALETLEKKLGEVVGKGGGSGEGEPADDEEARLKDLRRVIDEFNGHVRALALDGERGRQALSGSRKWVRVLAVVLVAPMLVGAGLAVEQQFSVLGVPKEVFVEVEAENEDQSGGWAAYIWSRYGKAIQDCERVAEDAGRVVQCELRVGEER